MGAGYFALSLAAGDGRVLHVAGHQARDQCESQCERANALETEAASRPGNREVSHSLCCTASFWAQPSRVPSYRGYLS